MLCRSPAVAYGINIVFFDHIVFIWWYGRQGATQSSGIDIIQFLVLLLAFQRNALREWGFIPELDPEATHLTSSTDPWPANKSISNIMFGKSTVKVHLNASVIERGFVLKGRATRVVAADRPSPAVAEPYTKLLGPISLHVAKFCWVDKKRTSERQIVSSLLEKLGDSIDWFPAHMPRILFDKDYDQLHTGHVRLQLLAEPQVDTYRVLRVLVFERLSPITDLKGTVFLKAFLDIILCHYVAWTRGNVYHRDPSLSNAMYRMVNGEYCGVLNDFDLATTAESEHSGLARTGTAPYMAMELLQAASRGESQKIKHFYRHDLEGFYWMLIWMCNCVGDDGKDDEDVAVFRPFKSGDYEECFNAKNAYERLDDDEKPKFVREAHATLWVIAKAWTDDFDVRVRLPEKKPSLRPDPTLPFETDAHESWGHFHALLGSAKLRANLKARGQEEDEALAVIAEFLERANLY